VARKKGLGRGLQQLSREVQIPAALLGETVGGRQQSLEVPLSAIDPNPYQPRMDIPPESLRELVESIKRHGVVEPVLLRPRPDGRYELVAGQRRLLAAREAGLNAIPAVVKPLDDRDVLMLSLVENIQREDLNPVDEARAFQTLSGDFALTHEQIAGGVGRGRSYVTNSLRLLTLERAALKEVASGRLSRGQALALLAIPPERRAEVLKKIQSAGLTVRQIERLAQEPSPVAKPARKPAPADGHYKRVEGQLEDYLGTRVRIKRRGRGGNLDIDFASKEDLSRLLLLIVKRENPF
jgi:ParB family chromosome partitioning protein